MNDDSTKTDIIGSLVTIVFIVVVWFVAMAAAWNGIWHSIGNPQ